MCGECTTSNVCGECTTSDMCGEWVFTHTSWHLFHNGSPSPLCCPTSFKAFLHPLPCQHRDWISLFPFPSNHSTLLSLPAPSLLTSCPKSTHFLYRVHSLPVPSALTSCTKFTHFLCLYTLSWQCVSPVCTNYMLSALYTGSSSTTLPAGILARINLYSHTDFAHGFILGTF